MTGSAGWIFEIQYFCVHDGPGIRTTVFFKGCPLRCLWCHNPEGIQRRKHLSYIARKCVNCGTCAAICPDVHHMIDGKHGIDWSACTSKGNCVARCPAGALELIGREITVEALVADVMKEKRYYQGRRGGVTISGGEPAMQPEFLLAVVQELKKEGVHVALETSGICDFRVYESVLPYVDLFLYDCKETDSELHRKFTGFDNKLILENLRRLYKAKAAILVRCPVIKGLNDREDHFKNLAALSRELPDLVGIEILPYHKLGVSKAEHMGLEPQEEYEQVSQAESDGWKETVRSFGGKIYSP